MSTASRSFSEREFYLTEFRRRSIGFAWPIDEVMEPVLLGRLVDELVANRTRVVLMSTRDDVLAVGGQGPPIELASEDFAPRLWRALAKTGCAGLRLRDTEFESDCERAALALRLAKVVWIQSAQPIDRARGTARVSVVDLAHLDPLLDPSGAAKELGLEAKSHRRALLEAIRGMIRGGVPAVNVCAASDIAEELLTYAGAGTFFTRDRYAEVRRLGLDDFDPANDLIERGEADGYLVPRSPASRDAVLAHGVGIFIEGRYLAGIGTILPYPEESAAEIASLYALTRYVGEGMGSQIVRHAIEQAETDGLDYIFSCTTSARVEEFFVGQGFRRVEAGSIPKEKWENYDHERRTRVRCLRFDFS